MKNQWPLISLNLRMWRRGLAFVIFWQATKGGLEMHFPGIHLGWICCIRRFHQKMQISLMTSRLYRFGSGSRSKQGIYTQTLSTYICHIAWLVNQYQWYSITRVGTRQSWIELKLYKTGYGVVNRHVGIAVSLAATLVSEASHVIEFKGSQCTLWAGPAVTCRILHGVYENLRVLISGLTLCIRVFVTLSYFLTMMNVGESSEKPADIL